MPDKVFIDIENVKSELHKKGVLNVDFVISDINKRVKNLISEYKPKSSIAKEQYKTSIPFYEVYSSIETLNLPTWVKESLSQARVMGASYQTIIFPDGTKYQLNNPLNNLSASEWLKFSCSVFSTFYSTNGKDSYAHDIRKVHPSPKPPQLMRDIISFFTKENECVLDYFMGVGGTLLGAGLCNRKAIGVDLNDKYIKAYKNAASKLNMPAFPTIHDDCMNFLKNVEKIKELAGNQDISLILIDPPYGNMMNKEKTGGDIGVYGKVATPFTNDSRDLGNMNIEECIDKLKQSISLAQAVLKNKGYIVVFIKDMQPKKKETNLLHSKIISKINEIPNIYYKGLKIWVDKSAKLFPYGYPLSFVANQIHHYILVFRKE